MIWTRKDIEDYVKEELGINSYQIVPYSYEATGNVPVVISDSEKDILYAVEVFPFRNADNAQGQIQTINTQNTFVSSTETANKYLPENYPVNVICDKLTVEPSGGMMLLSGFKVYLNV